MTHTIQAQIAESNVTVQAQIETQIAPSGGVEVEPFSTSENGTFTAPQGKAYSPVSVSVPQTNVQPLTATENGDYSAPEDGAFNPVKVAVPNTYTAQDEGKVVSNGALVAQTSRNITQNGTVDTTLNNSVVVSVPNSYTASDEGKVVSGGALVAQTARTVTENGTVDTTLNNSVTVDVPSKTEDVLSATENGTYTPQTGHVYSSAVVNVPTRETDLQKLIDRTITSIEIPSGTTKIGTNAFVSCTALASVVIPNTVTRIEDAFDSTALESIDIPDSVTAVYGLASLPTLKNITIGENVATFGYGAFRYLTGAESLTFRRVTPAPIGNTVFGNLNTACVIHVPAGSLNAYKSASNYPDPNIYSYVEDN